jgi:hypothetical protein
MWSIEQSVRYQSQRERLRTTCLGPFIPPSDSLALPARPRAGRPGSGIALIPATAPDFFTEDTPTAVLVRQVLGAIAQFEKTSLVAKLKAARDRKKAATGSGGRRSYVEARPDVVALAKQLQAEGISLRKISDHAGEVYPQANRWDGA